MVYDCQLENNQSETKWIDATIIGHLTSTMRKTFIPCSI